MNLANFTVSQPFQKLPVISSRVFQSEINNQHNEKFLGIPSFTDIIIEQLNKSVNGPMWKQLLKIENDYPFPYSLVTR